MLILVAVTVSYSIKSGLLGKAKDATTGYTYQEEEDEIGQIRLSYIADKESNETTETLKGCLENELTGEAIVEVSGENILVTYNETQNQHKIKNEENENIEEAYSFTLNDLKAKGIIYQMEEDSSTTFGTNLEEFVEYIGFESLEDFENSNYNASEMGIDKGFIFFVETSNSSFYSYYGDDSKFVGDGTEYNIDFNSSFNKDEYSGSKTNTDVLIQGSVFLKDSEEDAGKFTTVAMDTFMNKFGDTVFYLQDKNKADIPN